MFWHHRDTILWGTWVFSRPTNFPIFQLKLGLYKCHFAHCHSYVSAYIAINLIRCALRDTRRNPLANYLRIDKVKWITARSLWKQAKPLVQFISRTILRFHRLIQGTFWNSKLPHKMCPRKTETTELSKLSDLGVPILHKGEVEITRFTLILVIETWLSRHILSGPYARSGEGYGPPWRYKTQNYCDYCYYGSCGMALHECVTAV